ncbi:hypothetical protein AAC387_Pa03g1536 [Persea americana]
MTTNKDRIEQLESELQELKVSVQNMAGMEASIREVKDMLSKSHEKTSSFGSKDSNENVAFSGGGLSSSLPCPTKPGFPSYSGLNDMDGFDEEELGGAGDGHPKESPLISLLALTSCSSPRTMRVEAIIGKKALVVLIDRGSTHNFVDQKLAHDLHMAVTPIDTFMVKIANGERLICRERWKRKCRNWFRGECSVGTGSGKKKCSWFGGEEVQGLVQLAPGKGGAAVLAGVQVLGRGEEDSRG